MPTVRLTRAGAVEIEVPLEQRDLRIGRASDNDVVLKDPDKTLSRHHAELRHDGGRWFYLDLNSANGSWMGDRRVTREELTPGGAIGLGDYQLALIDEAHAAAGVPDDLNVTRVIRLSDTAVRPGAGAAAGRARPGGDPPLVGGAVSVGASPPPPTPASGALTPIRRVIIFGAIAVFGALAVMLALLLRPDPDAAVEQSVAPQTAAPATPAAPAPVASAPAVTPAPAIPPATAPPVAAVPPPATPPARIASTPPRKAAPRVASPRSEPAPRPARDTDPDAAAIPARDSEAPVALQQRRDDVRRRYTLALQQLAARQYVAARELLTGVAGDAPRFRDLPARLAEADAGLRQQAAEGFKVATKLEASAEWSEALREYERLRPYAAALPGLAEAVERTRTRMHEAGAEALTRARQFDSRGRAPEAIAWYQRAVAWLAPDHPGLEAARTRLAQLVNRP